MTKVSGMHEESAQRERGKAPGHRFAIGTSAHSPTTGWWFDDDDYHKVKKLQSAKPVSVGWIEGGKHNDKTLWWYKDEFYVEERSAPGEERKEGIAGLVKVDYVFERSVRGPFPGFEKHYYFASCGPSGENPTYPQLSNTEYLKARMLRRSRPVSVGTIRLGRTTKDRVLWWYKDEFYIEETYSVSDQRKGGVTGLTKLTDVREDVENRMPNYDTHYRFAVGTSRDALSTSPWLYKKEYLETKNLQSSKPVSLGTMQGGRQEGSTLWWYKDEFYVENDGYTFEEVQLLLWEREQKRTRKFHRLKKEMLSDRALEDARRERIPDDVRIFVWKRDEGRCVQCGSQDKLEFDHLIPVSKGGSNTARNIQLLCETCNRRKSDAT